MKKKHLERTGDRARRKKRIRDLRTGRINAPNGYHGNRYDRILFQMARHYDPTSIANSILALFKHEAMIQKKGA